MARYDMEQFLANPRVKVTALCDVDASFLAAARKLVPDARIYRDWRELLASEGDRIDSLNVSTPDHTHAVIAANAMRRGKHVYCQKPLCKYMDESAALRALAANSGVVTQLGTQIAAGSCERTAVEAMRSGMIGPVRRVILFSTRDAGSRIERSIPEPAPVPPTLDWDKWIGPAPMRPYAPIYHPLNWRIFTDFGSGWVGRPRGCKRRSADEPSIQGLLAALFAHHVGALRPSRLRRQAVFRGMVLRLFG